jgi:hypothetical protein
VVLTWKKISAKWSLILAWFFGFILAETFGVIITSQGIVYGISSMSSGALGNATIVSSRLVSLMLISRMSELKLKDATYAPFPKRKWFPVILTGIIASFTLSYVVNGYQLQLLGLNYFIRNAVPWAFPLQIVYYLFEIVVMNYMYLLAAKGWLWRRGPVTAGTLFLLLGWASLHVITKDVLVAVSGVVLVLILYVSYEFARSPLTPVILWLAYLTG